MSVTKMAGICSLNPTTLMTFKVTKQGTHPYRAFKGFLLLRQREVSSLLFSLSSGKKKKKKLCGETW
jgi:hypothetical protein